MEKQIEKQAIEEMAKELQEWCEKNPDEQCAKLTCSKCRAIDLYNAGYRKQSEGKWGFKGTAYGCSLCGYGAIAPIYNYCPNCGAKMKGGAE
jgi:rubrerythrin